MKQKFEKKFNKVLIGTILGSAILGFGGFSMSPKGKKFNKKLVEFLKKSGGFMKNGFVEMKGFITNLLKKK